MNELIKLSEQHRHSLLKLPQFNPENIERELERENAALTMCGGLLGTCYLLAECVDNEIIEAFSVFQKQKWWREAAKHLFKNAQEALRKGLNMSTNNSITSSQYMKEMADAVYEALRHDIYMLQRAIAIEVTRYELGNLQVSVEKMLLMKILYQCIIEMYDIKISAMQKVYPAYYDSWYGSAKFEAAATQWNKAVTYFANHNLKVDIELDKVKTIQTGVRVILNKLESQTLTDQASEIAKEYAKDTGNSEKIFCDAVDLLNVGIRS